VGREEGAPSEAEAARISSAGFVETKIRSGRYTSLILRNYGYFEELKREPTPAIGGKTRRKKILS
jgi:hypothetical protein